MEKKFIFEHRQNETPRISQHNSFMFALFFNSTTFHLNLKKKKCSQLNIRQYWLLRWILILHVDMLKICLLELRKFTICLNKYVFLQLHL